MLFDLINDEYLKNLVDDFINKGMIMQLIANSNRLKLESKLSLLYFDVPFLKRWFIGLIIINIIFNA